MTEEERRNLTSRRAASVVVPEQRQTQPLANRWAAKIPDPYEAGKAVGGVLPKVEAGVQAAGAFVGRGARQIAGMPGVAISNSILRPGYEATKGFLEGAGIIQPPRPVQTTPISSPVRFRFPQDGAAPQPPSLLRTPDMTDPVPAPQSPPVSTNPYNLPEYGEVPRTSRIEFSQPSPSRGSFNVISGQEMRNSLGAAGGGSRVLEMDPNLAEGALDFGRAERDRLNSLYARGLDSGLPPAEAAERARIETMALSSPGGLVAARALLGVRERLAGQKQAERKSLADAGYTTAQINQIEQTLPVDLAKRRAEVQGLLGQEERAQARLPYELEGLDWGNETGAANAATAWQRARIFREGKVDASGNQIKPAASATPENQKIVERIFGSISEIPAEMGGELQYSVPGIGRSLSQGEMAALMNFAAEDFAKTGVQKAASYYIDALQL